MLPVELSQVRAKSLFGCGDVRSLLRKLLSRSAPAAGRTVAFPLFTLHALLLSLHVPKKKILL
jgi:hypothetical protein